MEGIAHNIMIGGGVVAVDGNVRISVLVWWYGSGSSCCHNTHHARHSFSGGSENVISLDCRCFQNAVGVSIERLR